MTKLAALLAAVPLVALAAVPSAAQTPSPITMTVDAKVTPNKAGTKRDPQGVELSFTARFEIPEAYDPPLVDTVTVLFPRGGLYNGAKFPRCSQETLARKGLRGCPRGSIMGKGRGRARADDVPTHPRITVVNGGARKVFFYTVMNRPARVQSPVVGHITKLRGKWAYRLRARIPRVLQVVAGIPIVLEELTMSAGKRDWLATTSCPPSRRWPYHVETIFTTGETILYDDSVPCR
jgi:hypothetical protein